MTQEVLRRVIGIDPGFTGAICSLCPVFAGGGPQVMIIEDTPTLKVLVGKKQRPDYNIPAMRRIVKLMQDESNQSVLAVIEHVHAMPQNGSIGNFNLGRGAGIWEGILISLGIPYVRALPTVWKKRFQILQAGKEGSIAEATRRFPAVDMGRKDAGRAEALLLALYGCVTEVPGGSVAASA